MQNKRFIKEQILSDQQNKCKELKEFKEWKNVGSQLLGAIMSAYFEYHVRRNNEQILQNMIKQISSSQSSQIKKFITIMNNALNKEQINEKIKFFEDEIKIQDPYNSFAENFIQEYLKNQGIHNTRINYSQIANKLQIQFRLITLPENTLYGEQTSPLFILYYFGQDYYLIQNQIFQTQKDQKYCFICKQLDNLYTLKCNDSICFKCLENKFDNGKTSKIRCPCNQFIDKNDYLKIKMNQKTTKNINKLELCKMCKNQKEIEVMTKFSCGHLFCNDCIKHYAQNCKNKQLNCFYRGCNGFVNIKSPQICIGCKNQKNEEDLVQNTCKHWLCDQCIKNILSDYYHDNSRVFCPEKNCSGYVENNQIMKHIIKQKQSENFQQKNDLQNPNETKSNKKIQYNVENQLLSQNQQGNTNNLLNNQQQQNLMEQEEKQQKFQQQQLQMNNTQQSQYKQNEQKLITIEIDKDQKCAKCDNFLLNTQTFTASCQHKYCQNCTKKFMQNKIEKCIVNNCQKEFEQRKIQEFIKQTEQKEREQNLICSQCNLLVQKNDLFQNSSCLHYLCYKCVSEFAQLDLNNSILRCKKCGKRINLEDMEIFYIDKQTEIIQQIQNQELQQKNNQEIINQNNKISNQNENPIQQQDLQDYQIQQQKNKSQQEQFQQYQKMEVEQDNKNSVLECTFCHSQFNEYNIRQSLTCKYHTLGTCCIIFKCDCPQCEFITLIQQKRKLTFELYEYNQ